MALGRPLSPFTLVPAEGRVARKRRRRWPCELTEKQIRRGVHRSTLQLENAIRHFIQHHNQNPKPFVWTKSADQILDAVARFCKRTLDSGH
jgi:hypothetical protein